MRALLVGLVLSGCATTARKEAANEPLTDIERSCMQAVASNALLLASEALTGCDTDVDCNEVSALVAGRCGTFVNEQAFVAARHTIRENLHACDRVPQVVFTCPKLRAACREHRCQGETISEIPEACAEQSAALKVSAASSQPRTEDAHCGVFLGSATTSAWLEENATRRSSLSLACGTPSEPLFAVPMMPARGADAPPVPACNDGRCVILTGDEKFTTHVREKQAPFVFPQPDACLNAFMARMHGRLNKLSFKVTIARDGTPNQFEFLEPADLSPAAARSFAYQLHQCRMPVTRGGHPVAVRWKYLLELR